ncbi:MAG: hypothetical protein HKN25_10850 [Pyrinomonadaceae bacterium]|nr:hypothetical protein [Pyrinomonadaceae bacterium]
MTKKNFLTSDESILAKLTEEKDRIRKTLRADADDFEELQSEWQERDSASERNLRFVEWDQYSSLQQALVDVEDAILRVKSGDYGNCVDCDSKISDKRLLFDPAVSRCISCQEENEKASGLTDRKLSL